MIASTPRRAEEHLGASATVAGVMPTEPADDSPGVLAVVEDARAVVHEVCDALRPRLLAASGTTTVTAKADGTPVTSADYEADRALTEALSATFPDHAIVSEEAGTVWDGSPWSWVIDPIDGTSNFTAGIPYWCVSVALLHHGEPVYGCVDAPPIGARFEAVIGHGATRDGEPMSVRPAVDFRDGRNSHVPVVVTAGTIRRADRKVRLNPRILGSSALDLAMVAAGHVVAAYQRVPKVWDIAAGALLVREAGGVYVSLDPPLLPMRRGVDQERTAAAGVAGPDEGWVRDLVANLTPPRTGPPPSAPSHG